MPHWKQHYLIQLLHVLTDCMFFFISAAVSVSRFVSLSVCFSSIISLLSLFLQKKTLRIKMLFLFYQLTLFHLWAFQFCLPFCDVFEQFVLVFVPLVLAHLSKRDEHKLTRRRTTTKTRQNVCLYNKKRALLQLFNLNAQNPRLFL